MSKAFDKININRLIDSCKRIGIPQEALNFIKFLHQDRKAKTITAMDSQTLFLSTQVLNKEKPFLRFSGKFTMTLSLVISMINTNQNS